MKMINPEKSCIRDVNAHKAAELKRCGYTEYIEPVIEVRSDKPSDTEGDKKAGKTNKTGKNKTSKK